jgi:hypothetical protein
MALPCVETSAMLLVSAVITHKTQGIVIYASAMHHGKTGNYWSRAIRQGLELKKQFGGPSMANEFHARGPAWERKIVSVCGAVDAFALRMIHGSAMYLV